MTTASAMETRRVAQPGVVFWGVLALVVSMSLVAQREESLVPLSFVLVVLGTALQVQMCRKRTGLQAPFVAIPIIVLNVVAFCGFVFYPGLADAASVSARLPAGPETYRVAAVMFALTSVSLTAGALLSRRARGRVEVTPARAFPVINLPGGVLLLIGLVPLLLLVLAYTPDGIIERARYSDAEGPSAAIKLGSLTSSAGMVAASLAMFAAKDALVRAVSFMVVATYFVVVFAMGSRSIALMFAAVLIARQLHIGVTGRRVPTWALVLTGLLALESVNVALALRGVRPAGLGPYLAALVENPLTYLGFRPGGVFGNILFSVPLTGTVAGLSLPFDSALVSLTPLPSSFTDWAEVSRTLRINGNTPYNAIGELAAYGVGILIAYFTIVGLMITRLQQTAARLSTLVGIVLNVALAAATAAFTLTLLQYNLRSVTRQLWYVLLIFLVLRLGARRQAARAHLGGEPALP